MLLIRPFAGNGFINTAKPKTGKMSRQKPTFLIIKILNAMKKIFLLLPVILILTKSDAQNSIPSSIEVLGEPYIQNYISLVGNVGSIFSDLETKPNQFKTLSSLVVYTNSQWNLLSGSRDVVDLNKLEASMGGFQSGNYATIIRNLNVSIELKRIFSEIMEGTQKIVDDNSLNELLIPYSSNINTFNLESNEVIMLRNIIVGIYANYSIIISSNQVQVHCTNGRSWWQAALAIIKCGLSTVGTALVGAVAGAAVGTVALPIIGTVSGVATGFWGGAMVGASQGCL